MHEFSLVEALLDEVDRALSGRNVSCVTEIGVTCGPLSGVEPELLSFAFECLVVDRYGPGCRLNLDSVPLRVRCKDCGAVMVPVMVDLRCASCGGGNTEILEGGELILSRISFEEGADAPLPA